MWWQALADSSLVSGMVFAACLCGIDFRYFLKVLLFSLAHPELLLVVNHFSIYFQSALNTSGNVKPGSARLLLGEWDGVRRMFVRHRFFDFFSRRKVLLFSLAHLKLRFFLNHSLTHFQSALITSGNVVAGSGRLLLGEWDGVCRMFVRHRFSLFFKVLLFSLAHPELLLILNHSLTHFQSALNTTGNVKPGSARPFLGE